MNYPEPLYKGDTVGLIAPCSPINNKHLSRLVKSVTDLGFNVVLGESMGQSLYGYLSGADILRANDINGMFANDDIKAIFCMRGGYGSTRIMNLLNYRIISANPKIFVGYSDITSFHLAFFSLCKLVTFHGPMVCPNMDEDFDFYTKFSLFSALLMPDTYVFENASECPFTVIKPGRAKGRIIGGCLSLVSPSIGTFYQPDFTDTILFLEDIGETVPRCDKMMQHLINSGILDKVKGVLLGNFKDCDNPYDKDYTIEQYFFDLFRNYRKPVLYGLTSGHTKPMGTIPLGTICTMDSSKDTILFEYR